MPDQVTNYQCPACTGPLHFSAQTGKLECDYCGSTFDVSEIEALYAKKDEKAAAAFAKEQGNPDQGASADDAAPDGDDANRWDSSNMSDNWGADADGMRSFSCPSCGAELVCDATTAATSCPYCGNQTVVPGQFAGGLKPDYVIPFKLEKDAAVAALKNHYKGKLLLPNEFSKANHIDQIQGVYVPFWLFDAKGDADVTFLATRTRSWTEGDDEITETDHFRVHRAGSIEFGHVPVDASSKMPDDHMDSIEPFDYDALVPFSTAYLPGYLADRYDVSVQESEERADARCKETAVASLGQTVTGYDSVTVRDAQVDIQRGNVSYALLPVWLLSTSWNGKNYLFAMNGQTGKLVGDLPTDERKFWLLFVAIAAPLALLMYLWMFCL